MDRLPRIHRLEQLLGTSLAEVDETGLARLCAGGVREDVDVEFKASLYGGTDADKRALCSDVAAMANTRDAALILGVTEADGAADHLSPVPLGEDEELRIRSVLLAGIDPTPSFFIRRIPSADQGQGYYLLVVPRSPNAPHGVRVSEGYRFPARYGSRVRYLTESEIADAYRDRFRAAGTRLDRLEAVYGEGCAQLDVGDEVWLAGALVPMMPGSFDVRHRTIVEVRDRWVLRWSQDDFGHSLLRGSGFRTFAGVRRVIVSMTPSALGLSGSSRAELHADGSAFAARPVWGAPPVRATDPPPRGVDDECLVAATVSLLGALADHAVNAAGALGDSLLRLSLVGVPPTGVALVHDRQHGIIRQFAGTHVATRIPVSQHSADLGEMADSARGLLVASRTALTDIFQGFGFAEVPQITENGEMRSRYLSPTTTRDVLQWAQQSGVTLVDTTLEQEP